MLVFKRTILIIFCWLLPVVAMAYDGYKLRTVVVDAGHGGPVPGASYGGVHEKDITLAIALELGRMIESQMADVKVVYTRKTDINVPLVDRSKIANYASADLFISIHVNASEATSAKGLETFVMGPSKSSQNLDVAMRENNAIKEEKDYESVYDGFDPNSAESYIIFSLMQSSYLESSLHLASLVQSCYQGAISSPNRGVKQAGFLVLWRTAMPAILTEVGFLSNATERSFLTSKAGQKSVATSIFNGLKAYKKEVEASQQSFALFEGGANGVVAPTEAPKSGPNTSVAAFSAGSSDVSSTSGGGGFSTLSGANVDEKVLYVDQLPTKAERRAAKNNPVVFRVQVKSSVSKIPLTSANFGTYRDKISELFIDKRYKYFVGEAISYKEALYLQKTLRAYLFKDAFLVAYKNGVQIPIAEAIKVAP